MKVEEEVVHEENEWNICVVDETETVEENLEVTQGLKFSYAAPEVENEPETEQETAATSEVSLEELMRQMKSL